MFAQHPTPPPHCPNTNVYTASDDIYEFILNWIHYVSGLGGLVVSDPDLQAEGRGFGPRSDRTNFHIH